MTFEYINTTYSRHTILMILWIITIYYVGNIVSCAVASESSSVLSGLCKDENLYCTGPRILTTDNGRIISHPRFNYTVYSPNLTCVWVIMAPQDHYISIITTFMSFEYTRRCVSDSLSFYDGNGIDEDKMIARICGGSTLHKVISWSNALTIKFVSDASVNKMGFQLRFLFFNASTPDQVASDLSRSAKCGTMETRCNQSLECIAKSWLCDGIVDCQDGTDEQNCDDRTCASSTVNCSSRCIPDERFCGNVSECPELTLKFQLPSNVSVNETKTPRAGCSEQPIPNVERRVVGGIIARKGSWPWQISILHSTGVFCGGSIITGNWIVTAAHCVNGRLNPSDWKVYAGGFLKLRNEDNLQSFRVQRVIMHERYNSRSNANDIAVMMIDGAFTLNNYVQPVCVGTSMPPEDTQCYVTGWGQTQGTGGDGYLKQAQLPIIDHQLCNRWYGGRILNGMVCAGYQQGRTDACQGDSGGPLVCKIDSKYQLIGITSFGDGCGLPQKPGVYAAAPLYLNWMIEALQSN